MQIVIEESSKSMQNHLDVRAPRTHAHCFEEFIQCSLIYYVYVCMYPHILYNITRYHLLQITFRPPRLHA